MDNIRYEPLPNTLFKVKVPIAATYEDREIETFGLPILQDKNMLNTRDSYKQVTITMLPLDKIIDIYIKGFYIAVVDKEDISTIYNILENYLRGVSTNHTSGLNRGFVKEERLEDIERFATEMFGLNKSTIVNKAIKDSINHGFKLNMELMAPTRQPMVIEEYNKNIEEDKYAYLHNNAPNTNIDITQVKRTSYRRIY